MGGLDRGSGAAVHAYRPCLGSRRLLLDLAIGLGLGVLTFTAFSYGLDLSLPAGDLAERQLLPAEEGESP